MREIGIELPPVQPDLFRLVHRTHQKTNANGQQLHIRQRDPHVAGYDKTLVQHPVKDVEQIRCS